MKIESGFFLPPTGFSIPREVLHASFGRPPAVRKHHYTGARAQGIRYEKKVHEHLRFRYAEMYLQSPWLRFHTGIKWRYCQPDGIIFVPDEGRIIIVEVKYQFTSDAWWQVRQLYQRVLETLLPPSLWTYEACQIVKWYDPYVAFPEETVMACEVDMPSTKFKVHIWKP